MKNWLVPVFERIGKWVAYALMIPGYCHCDSVPGEKRSGIPKCRGAKSKIDDPSALANLKWNAFNFALLSYLTIGNKLKKYRAEIKGFVK